MIKKILFLAITLFSFSLIAQNVSMQNGTVNQCGGTLSDSGGLSGNYGDNENFTLTLCPDNPDDIIQLAFTQFSTQVNSDTLTIYDGTDTTAPLIGTYSGGPANSPGNISATLTSASGCITLQFVSDASANTVGFAANITCTERCQDIVASIDATTPAASSGTIQIPVGTNVDFQGSATFSDDATGAQYTWDFGEGAPANTEDATHIYNTPGTYTVTFTVSDDNLTGCSDIQTLNVIVLGPQIVVDQTTYTVEELIEDVLINSDCSLVSNIISSTGTNFGSDNGIGYFTGGVGTFDFIEGIILSSGNALAANGPETNIQSNGGGAWPGDADLDNAIGGADPSTNASFIQFDFTPVNNSISFDFIFASEEYGQFQCGFTDAFAFLLTDNVTNTTTNLAIVPGTTDVVSVLNVRDTAFNNTCPSVNPAFFDEYYGVGGQPVNSAPTNFIGHTVSMTANSAVVPDRSYTIKMVVADDSNGFNDTSYDAAVFLKAGSFDLSGDLGDDITIAAGTARCVGETVTLDTGVDPATPHVWTFNGTTIAGETGPTLDVTVSGTYAVEVQFGTTCTANDTVEVEFIQPAVINNTIDLFVCDNGTTTTTFNLTDNDPEVYGTQSTTDYSVTYYNSQADADVPQNPITNPTNYPGTDGEVIVVRIDDAATGNCFATDLFTLNYTTLDINPSPDMEECDTFPNDGFAMFTLTDQDASVLGTQNASDYNVTYYASLAEANAGTPNLVSPYENIASPQPIYVRIESITDPTCFSISPTPHFNLIVNPADDPSFGVTSTCDGGTVTITGDIGGTFSFNPTPTDGAVIDAATGEVTMGTPGVMYTIEYTTSGTCPSTTTQDFTVLPSEDSSFNMTANCSGAVATITGDIGGTFAFNPAPTDGAVLDATTGEITSGVQGATYTVDYTTSGACPSTTTVSVSLPTLEDASFTFTANCSGATATITGDTGGVFTFNPAPTDGAVIDATTGEITLGVSGTTYTVDYTTTGPCPESSTESVTVFASEDASFTVTPTCDGGTVTITGDMGGTFSFDPAPVDGAVIDTTTGTVTGGSENTAYGISYTTSGPCSETNFVNFNSLDTDDSSFTLTATCDGATAIITGVMGGTFAFNPAPTDGAMLDTATGTITNAPFEAMYTVEYTTSGTCPSTSTQTVTVLSEPVVVAPTPLEVCDDNVPDGFTAIDLSLKDDEITNSNVSYVVTYHFDQADANSGAGELPIPYTNVVNPQTVYARVVDTATGCYNTTSLELQVIQAPIATTPEPLEFCDPDADGFGIFDLQSTEAEITGGAAGLTVTYYETMLNAMNGADELASPYENIMQDTQTIYVRVENATVATDCASFVELELIVYPTPQILDDPTTIELCDDTVADGIRPFNLTINETQILNGLNAADYSISYYEDETDANLGNGSFIANPMNYTNTTAFNQVIWVRVEDDPNPVGVTNGCFSVVAMNLQVNPIPNAIQPTPLEECDELDANNYEDNDGFFTFDLTVKDTEITGGDASLVVSYYIDQANAETATPDIADATMFTNTVNASQTLWVRVENGATGCYTLRTLTIRVLPNPSPSPNAMDLELCDDNNSPDGIEDFDLTQNEMFILNGETNVTLTYYTDENEALLGTDAIVDPTMHSNEDPDNPGTGISPQVIYVRATNDTTGCYTLVNFSIIVNPLPEVPTVNLDINECEPNSDGVFTFDLTQNTATILGTQNATDFNVSYHVSLADAQNGTPEIATPSAYNNMTNPQEIFVNVTNNTTGCDITTYSFMIEVNDDAVAYPYANSYVLCDDNMEFDNNPNNDVVEFDLATQNAEVLGMDPANPQPEAHFGVSYYLTQAEADAGDPAIQLPLNYTNTVNPQEIYVRVDNNIPSQISLDITTIALPTGLDFNGDGTIDTYDTDADGVVDLIDVDGDGLSDAFDTDANPNTVEGIDIDGDGLEDLVDIDGDGIVDNEDSSFCYDTTTLTLEVNPMPSFDLDDMYLICANTNGTQVLPDDVIDTGLSAADYTFEWYLNGTIIPGQTGPSLAPQEGGNYAVIVTDIVTGCSSDINDPNANTIVEVSTSPEITATVTSDAFSENHVIEVTATGDGISVFEFSLDGGAYVSNEPNTGAYTFTDVSFGEHVITVRDKNGCGLAVTTVMVMDYPLFFTPNQDGFNDTWNISGISSQPDATIYIFDRMGKLLKQISPVGAGWDGTYNNNPMPTDDYWFTVEYREPNTNEEKSFKAHFTLKR